MDIAFGKEISGVPHLHEFFGYWAMQEEPFLAAAAWVEGMDWKSHMTDYRSQSRDSGLAEDFARVEGSPEIAVISLHGTLMKQEVSGQRSTSTVAARRQVRSAMRDDSVKSVLLHIDSPGGTVSGTADLADDVRSLESVKPTVAFIEDLGASAAYWVASQAGSIQMNRAGQAGAIGTFGVVQDLSSRAAMEGIKVHVIRAGAMKGAGVAGTAVTTEMLADAQGIVNALNESFLEGVAEGRGMPIERVRELADGRVHVGVKAVEKGLVDGISTIDEVIAGLARSGSTTNRRHKMPETTTVGAVQATGDITPTAPSAASYKQLKAACFGADAEFLMAQQEAEAGVDQATKAWMIELARQKDVAKQEAEDAKAETLAAKAAGGQDDVDLGGGTGSNKAGGQPSGDPEAFKARLQTHRDSGKNGLESLKASKNEDPEGYASYVYSHNIKHGHKKGAVAFLENVTDGVY